MRRKNKDQSAKVALASAGLVVLLVGVSVFSLYSLAESGGDGRISVASNIAEESQTAKLYLTETAQETEEEVTEKETAAAQTAVYTVVEDAEISVVDAVVTDSTIDEETVFEEDFAEDSYEEIVSEESYQEPVYEEVYEYSDPEPYYEPEPEYYEEPIYEEPVYEEPIYEEPVYEEVSYEEDSYTADGEWVYDYDIDDWVWVDYSYDNSTDSGDDWYDDSAADTSYEETGEWVYDYDIDDWVWVDYSYDNSTDSGDDWYDDSTADTSYEETGEWVYDYDIDDWVWVDYSYDNSTDSGDDWYDDSSDWEYTDYDTGDDSDYSYSSSLGQQIVDYAMGFVGVTPYVWAGRSLYSGTDCSGFINLIYDAFGIYCSAASLAYDGSSFGYIVSYDQLQPGDIVVYGGGDHVAIYAGNNMVIHCSSPENGTVYWNMYYRSDISWFLRVVD